MGEYEYEETEKQERKEQYDRLTAPTHIAVEHFSEHRRFEGLYENENAAHMFKYDRLMKTENMYGRLQMGYNPNRRRSFIFANIKTSKYDDASASFTRVAKEYEMKSLRKGNENRVFISKRRANVAVFLEKSERKPWSENSIKTYLNRDNMQTLKKVMPFLQVEDERDALRDVHKKQRELLENRMEMYRTHSQEEFEELHKQEREMNAKAEDLEVAIYRKEMQNKLFFRKINYAFDYQKGKMFEYYREQRDEKLKEMQAQNAEPDDKDDDDDDKK